MTGLVPPTCSTSAVLKDVDIKTLEPDPPVAGRRTYDELLSQSDLQHELRPPGWTWFRPAKLMPPKSVLRSIFRIGLAAIFFINASVAFLEPSSFIDLVDQIPMLSGLDNNAVALIGAHDILLGVLILSGRRRDQVYAWAGLWFLAISLTKLVGLLVY